MKIAFQMEHLRDTVSGENHSLLLIEEACRREFEVFHYHPDDISLSDKGIYAPVATAHVDQSKTPHYKISDYVNSNLADMDIIFFRQDPPFDMAYYTNTVMLEFLQKAGVMVVNDPVGIRNIPDKLSIFDFKDYMPPTLVSRDPAHINIFFETHKDVIIKPLYGFHGHGIERSDDPQSALKMLETTQEPLMFQPFLPEVFEGNKRILFYGRDIVGAINTIPEQGGDFRIYRDSTDVAYDLSPREEKMCAEIGKLLEKYGMMFVGIDLIGEYLTELNVGSVGSLVRFNDVYGGAWETKLFDVILKTYQTQNAA